MQYTDYKKSRNASWQILLDAGVTELPVKITDVCRKLQLTPIPFKDMPATVEQLQREFPDEHFDGIIKYINGEPAILYDDSRGSARSRFTIAHELGHLVLGHVTGPESKSMFRSRFSAPEEEDANVFARDTLAPACVLWGVGVTNASQIQKLCNISGQSASIRMGRMKTLYEREREFLATRGYSCFLLSPLECKLYEQFLPYIESHKL